MDSFCQKQYTGEFLPYIHPLAIKKLEDENRELETRILVLEAENNVLTRVIEHFGYKYQTSTGIVSIKQPNESEGV